MNFPSANLVKFQVDGEKFLVGFDLRVHRGCVSVIRICSRISLSSKFFQDMDTLLRPVSTNKENNNFYFLLHMKMKLCCEMMILLRGNLKDYSLIIERLKGKELDGMSFPDLISLENQLNESLHSVKDQKVMELRVCQFPHTKNPERLQKEKPGIWRGKGQGKTFQTELIFKTMGVEPVIMSAGELESDRAGEPGRLIRDRYRTASQVIQNQGKMSVLMINDIDAGLGRFGETQMTVNNQIVVGTLMNLADNPTRVSVGQDWREADIVNRVPLIVTGNDFSTLYAPLIREGRMEKFYWQPTREDIVNIVSRMYEKDGTSRKDVTSIVDKFPNQALDFYGALRSRTYDRSILKWVDEAGGMEILGKILLRRKKTKEVPQFTPPEQTVEALLESGYSLIKEQKLIMKTKLSIKLYLLATYQTVLTTCA